MCYENHFAGRHTNSPRVHLTTVRMCTSHKWLPSRQNLMIPGAGREALKGCPSSTQPCQANHPLDCITAMTWHSEHLLPIAQKQKNHTNQRMLGLCKMLWDYERYTKSKTMNYSNSHRWFYSIAAQMDLVLMVWKLLIKNCLVGRWEKVVNDGSREHVMHLLITKACKKAFVCQRAYSAQLSKG